MLWGKREIRPLGLVIVAVLVSGCAGQWFQDATAPAAPALVETRDALERAPGAAEIESQAVPELPPPADVWERIRRGLTLGRGTDPKVTDHIDWLRSHPQYLARVAERAEPFLYFIVAEVERREMPVEVALLPIVESAFRARAQSRSGAVGIWQFLRSTASRFGLQRSPWYDGRRDVVASTYAALDYLEILNRQFDGDWLLALAAYNAGPTTVNRVVKHRQLNNQPYDFWSIAGSLPGETEQYVPRLLAVAAVVGDPAAHELTLPPIANAPAFETADLDGPLDLRLVPEWLGMPADEFRALNPGYSSWYANPGGPFTILIPLGTRDLVMTRVAEIPPSERLPMRYYVVQRGDTLSAIAVSEGASLTDLRSLNGIRGNLIRVGQKLAIRAAADEQPATFGSNDAVHIVHRGDTLWDLARNYELSVRKIAHANGLTVNETLYPGQALLIPRREGEQLPASADGVVRYSVRKGDSLWTISRRFNVSIQQLRNWNRLNLRNHLKPGQVLIVRRDDPHEAREI